MVHVLTAKLTKLIIALIRIGEDNILGWKNMQCSVQKENFCDFECNGFCCGYEMIKVHAEITLVQGYNKEPIKNVVSRK